MKPASFLPALFLCALFCAPAWALSVIPPTFDELIQNADTVVRSEVVSTRCEWRGEGTNRRIVTMVRLRIERCLVGEAAQEIEIQMLGGKLDGKGLEVSGMPNFHTGDRDILFIRNNGKSFCPLVAVGHGRYLIVQSEKNASAFVARNNGEPLVKTADHGCPVMSS
jgi:hypothetical protein